MKDCKCIDLEQGGGGVLQLKSSRGWWLLHWFGICANLKAKEYPLKLMVAEMRPWHLKGYIGLPPERAKMVSVHYKTTSAGLLMPCLSFSPAN
jgi:hypothetical protein